MLSLIDFPVRTNSLNPSTCAISCAHGVIKWTPLGLCTNSMVSACIVHAALVANGQTGAVARAPILKVIAISDVIRLVKTWVEGICMLATSESRNRPRLCKCQRDDGASKKPETSRHSVRQQNAA